MTSGKSRGSAAAALRAVPESAGKHLVAAQIAVATISAAAHLKIAAETAELDVAGDPAGAAQTLLVAVSAAIRELQTLVG